MIGKLLPSLCRIANVPVLTNHSVRPTSVRAMRRAGFERSDIQFISGHKSVDSLANYDALTVYDRTKIALAIQKGHATLDGDKVDLDKLARGEKRKADEPAPSTSRDDPIPSTSKKVTFDEVDLERAEFVFDEDSGLGIPADIIDDASDHFVEVKLPIQETNSDDVHEPALPSSQAHNVAQLIRDQMNTSKELINSYISAMKKK